MLVLAVIVLLAGTAHAAPTKDKVTHILCPHSKCPSLVEHYKQLGWVRGNKTKQNKTLRIKSKDICNGKSNAYHSLIQQQPGKICHIRVQSDFDDNSMPQPDYCHEIEDVAGKTTDAVDELGDRIMRMRMLCWACSLCSRSSSL